MSLPGSREAIAKQQRKVTAVVRLTAWGRRRDEPAARAHGVDPEHRRIAVRIRDGAGAGTAAIMIDQKRQKFPLSRPCFRSASEWHFPGSGGS